MITKNRVVAVLALAVAVTLVAAAKPVDPVLKAGHPQSQFDDGPQNDGNHKVK